MRIYYLLLLLLFLIDCRVTAGQSVPVESRNKECGEESSCNPVLSRENSGEDWVIARATNRENSTDFSAPQHSEAIPPQGVPRLQYDVTNFGGYIGVNYKTPIICDVTEAVANCPGGVSDFLSGLGVVIPGAGASTTLPVPQKLSVTPQGILGSTSIYYCVANKDWFDGISACSRSASTSKAVTGGPGPITIKLLECKRISGITTCASDKPHGIQPSEGLGRIGTYPEVYIPQLEADGTSEPSFTGTFVIDTVPDDTHLTFTQYGKPDGVRKGGSAQITAKIRLDWDTYWTYSITAYSCDKNGNATLSVDGILTDAPYGSPIHVTGLPNQYDGFKNIGSITSDHRQIAFRTGCSGTSKMDVAGTVQYFKIDNIKDSLIYRCIGDETKCAKRSNYALIGSHVGNDTYFLDEGFPYSPGSLDLGDAPSSPPDSATRQYLNTTIATTQGNSLILTNPAAILLREAKVYHDNVPNLTAACNAAPAQLPFIRQGLTIYIPARREASSEFPINANFDMVSNCKAGSIQLEVDSLVWAAGTIKVKKNSYIRGLPGGSNSGSIAPFYELNTPAQWTGPANPLFYFCPENCADLTLENLVLSGAQSYQSGLYGDNAANGDGSTSQRFIDVHVTGGQYSYPYVLKGGFGFFWHYGGWAVGGESSPYSGRGAVFTTNCTASPYFRNFLMPGIIETHDTYVFGGLVIESCGQHPIAVNHLKMSEMLAESTYVAPVRVNIGPAITGNYLFEYTFENISYADFLGGYATPMIDITKAQVRHLKVVDGNCGSGYQPVFATSVAGSYGSLLVDNPQCNLIGIQSYVTRDPVNHYDVYSNTAVVVTGSTGKIIGQLKSPFAPKLSSGNGGKVCNGESPCDYSGYLTGIDVDGVETVIGPAATLRLSEISQTVEWTAPTVWAPGTVYMNAYRSINGSGALRINGSTGCKNQLSSPGTSITDSANFTCGVSPPLANKAGANILDESGVVIARARTGFNCTTSECGSAIAGTVALPSGNLTVTINTSSVTSDSEILVTESPAKSKRLGIICNGITGRTYSVSSITTEKSFTITASVPPSKNPACLSWMIIN